MGGYQAGGYLLIMAVVFAISAVAFVLQFFLNSGKTAKQYRDDRAKYGPEVARRLASSQFWAPTMGTKWHDQQRNDIVKGFERRAELAAAREAEEALSVTGEPEGECSVYVKRGDGYCKTCGIHWYDHAK